MNTSGILDFSDSFLLHTIKPCNEDTCKFPLAVIAAFYYFSHFIQRKNN